MQFQYVYFKIIFPFVWEKEGKAYKKFIYYYQRPDGAVIILITYLH